MRDVLLMALGIVAGLMILAGGHLLFFFWRARRARAALRVELERRDRLERQFAAQQAQIDEQLQKIRQRWADEFEKPARPRSPKDVH